ncbi:MAG TPA: radical SAM protein, partial [Myxococcota bacterium]|nr:radical SAM protein [Myxococcota bacterium]
LPAGMIPQQIDFAFQRLRTPGSLPPRHLKLYNSGSFFDPKAIPSEDYPAIASRVASFERVIVECHPSLIGPRVAAFDRLLRGEDASSLDSAARLEGALGLETAHPEALRSLNKGLTVPGFQRACAVLQELGVAIRVFLLVHPPFVPKEEQRGWLERSLLTALEAGASVVSLIPLRLGNGALDELAEVGLAAEPSLSALEDALDFGVGQQRARVFADLWDLDRFSTCAACLPARRTRLEEMNRGQRVLPRVSCSTCQYS